MNISLHSSRPQQCLVTEHRAACPLLSGHEACSLSLIRKIAVKGNGVKVCSPSTANLVHVITNSNEIDEWHDHATTLHFREHVKG